MPLPSRRFFAACVTLVTTAVVLLGLRHPPEEPPALVVVVTVDQLRPDYFSRFGGQWTGGFRRLLDAGAVFPNGLQDHALTETAPGHATMLSGRDPARTGIPSNHFGVPDTTTTLIGFPGVTGASPRRFQGTTLVDWLKAADSGLKFLSVSQKDRSAILPVGRAVGPVYWFNDGRFTTSSYYADSLPAWLTAWQGRGGVERLAGTTWSLLLPDSAYAEVDAQPFENGGRETGFPHRLSLRSAPGARALADSPWMDSLTLDVALDGVRVLGLGRRRSPDLLAVGLSATDHVGHDYGPDSRELHDHLLRLDRWFGTFLDSLQVLTAGRPILLVLSADHGVVPFPEYARQRGLPGGRVRLGPLVRDANREIGRRVGDSTILEEGAGLIFGDRERLRTLGVNPESLATTLAPRVWSLPGVVNAWTPATLPGAFVTNLHARRWGRSLPPKFSWLISAQVQPGYIWSGGTGSTTHGTTNQDDVGVPIVFLGPGIRAGLYGDTVRTVDIAPTLAKLLRVRPEGKLDGREIKPVIKR